MGDINQHEQEVQRVVQEISVMSAVNRARIANIAAEGRAMAKEIVANATKNAFDQKQNMKAHMYSTFQRELHIDDKEMGRYFGIKSLQSQMADPTASVIVGVDGVTET